MDEPVLAKPGAGLPFVDSLYLRWYLGPFVSRKADKTTNLRHFTLLGSRVLREANGVPEGQRDAKVLVPAMRGIEDSSRYWSANEVLEHLMIVGTAMRGLIQLLAEGKTSDYVVRIADVKPKGKYKGGDARRDFTDFINETVKLLEPLDIVDGGPKHEHPWFGGFNSLQWTWLLAGHSGIHLNQLIAIKKGLPK